MIPKLERGVTLVLGGARSGKSAFAEGLVEASSMEPIYLATGRSWDDEMAGRIETHRERRGDRWKTVEEPLDLATALGKLSAGNHAVLVDCLTLWLTNLMMEERKVEDAFDELERLLPKLNGAIVLVSNEVGLGIVPDNRLAREFRDRAGQLHQSIARVASTVYFVAAGLPLKMKG